MRAVFLAVILLCAPLGVSAQQAADWPASLPDVPLRPDHGALGPSLRSLQTGDVARALAITEGAVERDVIAWLALRGGLALPGPDQVGETAATPPPGAVLPEPGELARIMAFLERRADWPSRDVIVKNAEARISPATPAADVLAFFEGRAPTTADGAMALAAALRATGAPQRADAVLIETWRTQPLIERDEARLLDAYGELLAAHHWARADAMLWRERRSAAQRMLPLLSEPQRALAGVRLAYIAGSATGDVALAALPATLRSDPGLAQARFTWLAERGEAAQAVALLKSRTGSAEALGQPARWASWRRSLARRVMREGEAALAYALASEHHLDPETDPRDFADLEWLSGYVALKYLNAPARAQKHFEAMRAVVVTPISQARAQYWLGAALEAQGERAAARASWRGAAQFQGTFYGLAAAERLILRPDPGLDAIPPLMPAQDDMLTAMDLLMRADEDAHARRFASAMGKTRPVPALRVAAAKQMEAGDWTGALWLAKRAYAREILLPEALFPLHPLAEAELGVDPALALAIARQESEFRVSAGSGVGAMGLMQLMPGTAQDMARAEGLPYNRTQLLTSWEYNAALGGAYLRRMEALFGDSPVLIAAAYNAGPGRAQDWIAMNGDPRTGIDVIDWIEHIPYRETRNYVMRVTEGQAAYRMRLGLPHRSFEDLLRGELRRLRPRLRPEGLGVAPVILPEPALAAPLAVPSPSPTRPRARPSIETETETSQ